MKIMELGDNATIFLIIALASATCGWAPNCACDGEATVSSDCAGDTGTDTSSSGGDDGDTGKAYEP